MNLPAEQVWLVLSEFLSDLIKRDIEVPTDINKNMGFTKTQISFYKKDTSHPDMIKELSKANITLSEMQNKLLDVASENVSEEYANEWFDKLKRANRGEKFYDTPDIHSKFNLNPPPGFSTGRITLKKPITEDRVQEIAEYYGLIIEFEDDVTLSLYGDKSDVKKGIQEMAGFFFD